MKWAVGITTVPERADELFPRTVQSLHKAGFTEHHVFTDGAKQHLTGTARTPRIGTYGNWLLGALELFIRSPAADRYAMFQDDLVAYPNLREYLESCKYPEKGYWNLYTFPENAALCRRGYTGWYESNQMGLGAVALVFDRTALVDLLATRHMVERPMDAARGAKSVDGAVVTALKKEGYKEYVHNPSLVNHTGHVSVMFHKPYKPCVSFKGEGFDARRLIR